MKHTSSGRSPLRAAARPGDAARANKGRGALSNPTGRFEPRETSVFDDGWGTIEQPPSRPETQVTPEVCRQPFARNDSPDVPFDRSLNPYKGCEHGCVYCFARPTHAYLGLSPGLDFETKIFSKPDLPQRLREALSRAGYRPETVALGANTDPYQPAEREERITRRTLEVLAEFRHPVTIVTKSQAVLRDVDLLGDMARDDLASVLVSITTLDPDLAGRMEPRATSPRGRVETLHRLTEAGIPCGVLASPMIPGLNDVELEAILEAAATAGARCAGYLVLRLPLELKDLFFEWLSSHYPDRVEKVRNLLLQMHDGALYRSEYGARMRGTGAYALVLARRFETATRRLGMNRERTTLDVTRFRVPPRTGQNLELFDAI